MKNVSIVALLSVGLFAAAATFAQDTSVEVSGEVSASGEVSVSTPDLSSALSSVTSEVSSAVSSVSSELSSALSSVSSELSGELSSVSSELSSALSSEEGGGMISQEPVSCGTDGNDLDVTTLSVGALDTAALAAVASVSVVVLGDCSGLSQIDGNAQATLATHPAVIAALSSAGEAGAEIVAYALTDGSLTVYVKQR